MKISAYILHTRPQSYPVTFFAAFTGYALSPSKGNDWPTVLVHLLLIFILFSILLWGGTNAFNSGQDGEEGPLTLLPNPPAIPAGLSLFGLLLMFTAVALAGMVSLRLVLWTLTGLALSVFYSWQNKIVPRGKDIPVLDMLINSFGFGFCSILFGYMITDAPVTPAVLWAGVGFSFAYLGGMPTSQIFQLPQKKGSPHNYTSLFGPVTVLRFGAFFFLLHVVIIAYFHADVVKLIANFPALMFWLGWLLLVLVSSVHSLWWSWQPFVNSYKRMNRQMVMMMLSQVLWTISAWLMYP